MSTPQQREELLRQYERSGLSGPRFAAAAGVKYQTLASWLQRESRCSAPRAEQSSAVGEGQQPHAVAPMQWMEAVVEPKTVPSAPVQAQAQAMVRVELPGGAVALLSDFRQIALVAELIQALQNKAVKGKRHRKCHPIF